MQNEMVLAYMKGKGSITSMEAFTKLGVTRLSARIYDLKEKGVKIQSQRESSIDRHNQKTHFNRYFLMEE